MVNPLQNEKRLGNGQMADIPLSRKQGMTAWLFHIKELRCIENAQTIKTALREWANV
mgnify:FL=1